MDRHELQKDGKEIMQLAINFISHLLFSLANENGK